MLLAAADVSHHASRPAIDPRTQVPIMFHPVPAIPVQAVPMPAQHFALAEFRPLPMPPPPAMWYGTVTQRKAKKTWGERLRLPTLPKLRERWKDRDGPGNPARMAVNYGTTKQPTASNFGTVTSQSALAKSMEYAEPWLYGTYGRSSSAEAAVGSSTVSRGSVVAWSKPRGATLRSRLPPGIPEAEYEEIASPVYDLNAILCACKTASHRSRSRLGKDCKRCGSTRGSIRRSTTNGRKSKGRSRPSLNSVLSTDEDPYSFMRQARMLTGASSSQGSVESFSRPATLAEEEECSYQEFPDYISATKNRFATVQSIRSAAKSSRANITSSFSASALGDKTETGSVRGRRDRDASSPVNGAAASAASSWDAGSFGEEEFFDASDRLSNGIASPPRKSILECSVNAYDLMKRLAKPDLLGYDSGSDELSDNALTLDHDPISSRSTKDFKQVDHAVVSGLRSLRNGPPSYQLLSDGEGEEVSTSSECTVNTSSSNSLYGIGTMSSNSNAGSVDDGPDYAKISDHDVQVIQPPLPPPLPDRLLTKQLSNSDGAPPPPPLPPPPPPFPLGLGARRDSNESDTSSGVSDDSDAPKRPPRHKRSIGMADRPAAMMKRVSSCDSVSKVLGNQQDAVISQLKSILKKPLLQPVARSHNAPDKATVDKDREESSKSAPRRSDSADELEHHFKHRKKKQVQFRSSADITVLSQDSSSGDDFSEELESELESIFKRMKLNSRWALPSKPEDDVQPEEASKAHSEDDQQGEDESPSPPEVQPSVPESQADEDVPSSEEETTFFSTVVVRTPSEDETFRGNGSTHFRRGAIRRSLSDRPSAAKSAVFNDTMRLRLGTGRKTIIDVFSSANNAVVEQPAASPTEAVATTSSDLENAATKKLVEYFSTKTTKRPKVPPPPPPPPRNKTMKAPTTVTVTLGPNGGDSSEDSGNYSMGTVKSDGPSDEPSSVGVNSSPVMESSATAGASVNNDGSASSTSNNPLADYQLSSFDDSQSKNVLAPTGGPTASNPMSNSSATSDGSATSAIIERYKKAAIRITTCGTIESPAEVVECDYTVSDSSHVGEGQEPGPTCITISATRRSCLSNILVIKNEMDDQLTCRGATGFSGDDDDLLQKDLDEVEALYEEISEPIYEEVMNGDPSKSTALEYEQCLKRCLLGEDQNVKSLFDGASRDEILTYLEGVRDRATTIAEEEDSGPGPLLESPIGRRNSQNRISNMSSASDSSSDDSSTRFALSDFLKGKERRGSVEVERNDSGVGSETSKPSLSRRAQHGASQALPPGVRPHRTPKCCGDVVSSARMVLTDTVDEDHMCEDCDQLISSRSVQRNADGFVPLTCWKCRRRRQERKELIMEIVETEMKYGRDLHIIQEEFYRPMLVAGLLTADQLAGVFLNLPELRDWNRRFTDRLRDALEIALEHGDEDLLTVNLGRLFFQAAPMLHAFETYCLRQGTASVLLSNMEKEKELLRIFLKVSQMENTLLRRMNLSSFLMVPVQRVTKYPLLLGRLYKVTPHRLEGREAVREAQRKIEAHLEHINSEAKELSSTKLWRRISIISASSSVRRLNTTEADQQVGNIRLRKLALDILEWSADSVCFAMEGKLSFTQAGDNMWTRRGRNVKLTPTYAVLVIKGNLTSQYNPAAAEGDVLFFARRKGIEQAALLLARERNNTRYSLIRDPLMLDKCIISSDTEVEGYFEVHDHSSKETIYFKADTPASSSLWFRALQYHCHSLGHWRRRRNALANIMIDGMGIDKSQC